ncbi:MAG: Carboxypeptidase regulatory-like domain [Chloroflexota bacterium]|jgi:hypothetical protein
MTRLVPLLARPSLLALALVLVPVACVAPASTPGPAGTLAGRAEAGPVCPVESVPPDPACAPRPVPGATVVVLDPDGREVVRATTDETGAFAVELPAGDYLVTGEPVEGLMGGAPPAVGATVVAGTATEPVVLAYDTGIR